VEGFQIQYLIVLPVVLEIRRKEQWSGAIEVPKFLFVRTHRSQSSICRLMPWNFEGFGREDGLFEQGRLI